ncbi:hypothetical protein VNO77_04093 [Canavalia gladiata]|uniref:Uncharacterized protein n=1 Tax=Canavalia gladiata TaxID=3824 RepID=A0AAN9MWS0_CANGL
MLSEVYSSKDPWAVSNLLTHHLPWHEPFIRLFLPIRSGSANASASTHRAWEQTKTDLLWLLDLQPSANLRIVRGKPLFWASWRFPLPRCLLPPLGPSRKSSKPLFFFPQ